MPMPVRFALNIITFDFPKDFLSNYIVTIALEVSNWIKYGYAIFRPFGYVLSIKANIECLRQDIQVYVVVGQHVKYFKGFNRRH